MSLESFYSRTAEIFAVMGKRAEGLKDLRSPDDWEIVESIGEGTYGEVFKVRNTKTDEIAAAKVIDSILEKIDEVLPELEILKKYSDHPHIAGFFGAYIKRDSKRQDQLWLLMELCRGGSVTNLARNLISKGKLLEEDLIAYILYETLKGIDFLHRNCVMHRDIKGQNVMLTNDAEIRLIDFGVSAQLAHVMARRNSSVGTPFWMAPEVIACEQQLEYNYDLRCDVWSLGITAIELADGHAPLSDEHPMRALFKIPRSKPATMRNPEKWSHEYRDFIAKCLVKDFEERSHAKDLLTHPFLSWVPTKVETLRRKLRGVMDSQYHGKDGIMDEMKREKESSQGRALSVEGHYVKPSARRNKEMMMVDDLTTLPSLTDEIILSHLLERFLGHQIYTYIGDILIAVNPLQSLNIYTKKHSEAYRNVDKSSLPPHIFMVADMTYKAMIHNKTPQCCLISGESGAGKTVSANYLVQQLAELGKNERNHDYELLLLDKLKDTGGNKTLEEKILQVNPLMEALGNAQTVINDNSSRFGKYLELHFTSNGSLIGACLTEYLLEKSRVVFQSTGERNFHIFYYMIAGLANQKKLEKYSFKLYSQHSYLQTGGRNLQDVVCTMGNKKKFEEVQRCLDVIGFSNEEVSSLFSVLAAIIHIGDIVFTEDESVSHLSDKSMVNNPQMLVIVSSLLELNAVELRDALTTNSNVTRGETIIRNNTVEQAVDCRDAMAKALYGRLFSWIVKRINALLRFYSAPIEQENEYRIGILDIFGFENFKTNSFEQLCINIANEQIQFYFNQQIFSWELEEYRLEGVDLTHIKFEDNRPVLDMFLQKPIGILALLDEESRFPRATDFTLIDKFNSNIKVPFYQRPKEKENMPSFCVMHYAGKVKYDATNFLEKNRDTLSPDVVHVLRTSDNKLVRTLLQQLPTKEVKLRNSIVDEDHCWWRIPRPFLDKVLYKNQRILLGVGDRDNSFKWKKNFYYIGKYRGRLELKDNKRSSLLFAVPHPSQSQKMGLLGRQGSDGRTNSSSTGRLNQTVSMHFRSSLKDLLSKLLPSQSHFVRCIRPNESMIPGRFDQEKVMTQLKYTGILETTRIRKQGYSERPTFEEFITRYHVIGFPSHREVNVDAATCTVIVKAAGLENYIIGRTKIFMKYYHVDKLMQLLEDHRARVILAQSVIRCWLAKRRYQNQLKERSDAAVHIQTVFRGHIARQVYRKERERVRLEREERERQALILQKLYQKKQEESERRELAYKNQQATKMQAAVRGYLVRKNLESTTEEQIEQKYQRGEGKRNRAAVIIQSNFRGYYTRKQLPEQQLEDENEGYADIKTVFFLQQIIDTSGEFYEQQQRHTKPDDPADLILRRRATKKTTAVVHNENDQINFYDESSVIANAVDPSEIESQQETKRIYFVQQIENSLGGFLDRLQQHVEQCPSTEELNYSEVKPARNRFRDIVRSKFSIKPHEVQVAEQNRNFSQRGQRSFRKEIWSAGDETYLRSFADDSKQDVYQHSQSKRIEDMLSLVEGLPSDSMKTPDWLEDPNNNNPTRWTVLKKRSQSPPTITVIESKTSENISQSRLRAVPPHARRYEKQEKAEPKPEEPVFRPVLKSANKLQTPQRQTSVERNRMVVIEQPPKQEEPVLRPVFKKQVSNERFTWGNPERKMSLERNSPVNGQPQIEGDSPTRQYRVIGKNSSPDPVNYVLSGRKPSLDRTSPVRENGVPERKPVDKPMKFEIRKPSEGVSPAKPLVNHETFTSPFVPSPQNTGPVIKRNHPKYLHDSNKLPQPEKVKLKPVDAASPQANGVPDSNELYSHVLKKTGRRSKLLGVPDDDSDDQVTRIDFNVPLKAAS